jgi:hypothetical protein
MSGKTDFAERVRQAVTDLTRAQESAGVIARVFSSRGYETGGADELAQIDLDGLLDPPAIADLAAFVVMIEGMETWLGSGDRQETLDRLRLIRSL